MNKEIELLAALKENMILTEAKALGAQHAFQQQAVRMAMKTLSFYRGQKIVIDYSDGPKAAYFDGISWCEHSPWCDGYSGPVMHGYRELAKGGKAKTREALLKVDPLAGIPRVRRHP